MRHAPLLFAIATSAATPTSLMAAAPSEAEPRRLHRCGGDTISRGDGGLEFKPDLCLATLLNCMLWVFYGLPLVHPNSILVVTINGIGLVIESAYLIIFFIYATRNTRVRTVSFRRSFLYVYKICP
jgi:hypothetical protein